MNIPDETLDVLREKRGLVATVCTSGSVEENFAWAMMEVRSWCDRNDFHKIEWRHFANPFVTHGRDEVLGHALKEKYDWCLQVDADAAPIPPDLVPRILNSAFVLRPDSDVMGGYAQLKQPPFLPTIDTGTGRWEPIFPGEGILPVIRTGAHCLLVKPPILRRFGPPWFSTRRGVRPIDALAEVDNFARIHLDGRNPLSLSPSWTKLMEIAREQLGGGEAPVGEDSGFCDAVKAAGGNLYVDTDLVIGHIGKRTITPDMLREEMEKVEERYRAGVGIYE